MIVESAKLDTAQYAVQYELLRAQVIGSAGNSAGPARGVGLALLLSKGMPGWLKTVEAVLRASVVSRAADSPDPSLHELPPQNSAVPPTGPLSGCSGGPAWLSSVHRNEVTALLASLVLSTRPIAHQALREGYR